MNDSIDGIFIEFFFTFISKCGREHCTSTHNEIGVNPNGLSQKNSNEPEEKNSTRQSSSVKVNPCNHKKVEKCSVVGNISTELCSLRSLTFSSPLTVSRLDSPNQIRAYIKAAFHHINGTLTVRLQ